MNIVFFTHIVLSTFNNFLLPKDCYNGREYNYKNIQIGEMLMITVHNVAGYFLHKACEDEESLTNLKLQKLTYYAQAFHLAIFGTPLFKEEFEAWMHGPVCPELYRAYKSNGSAPIPPNGSFDDGIFSEDQIQLLDEVNSVYGQFSAWKLRNISHEDAPWQEKEDTGGIIEKSKMMEFYKSRLL
ncbi:SocA family protein [Methylovulum psychrotolerans]|uniref:Panacea domain-containing protein n=1 Tax=Methylovulum psychrotolerans TaxID=1704499 RepID=UPI001BFF7FBE|nr:type II toxin-antitoxin system antitoxin SocA domain-containing protein [Methylovulum psychrotolerans]MBT9096406.1 SocA family protein [Methylovulum psychrotolerans]